MSTRGGVVAGIFTSWLAAGAAAADSAETGWVTLRVGRVQVKPTKADSPAEAVEPAQFNRGMIMDVVARIRPDVQACGSRSTAKGTVKVAVTVRPAGGGPDVSIVGTPDPALGDCVAAAMRKAVFPPTKSGGSFTYPFVF